VESWNTYWSNNTQGDCFSLDGRSGLSRILSDYWCNYFHHKGQGARVLDLACGNGFVGKCAIQSNTNLLVMGADNATDIGQTEFQVQGSNSRLKLLTGINIEQLKFAKNEFDFIVSQFGLEYSDFSSVIRNIIRQLKPKGEINLILHHPKSVLCQQSQTEVTILNYLLTDTRIFETIREFCEQNNQQAKNKLSDITDDIISKGLILASNNKELFFSVFNHLRELISKIISFHGFQLEEIDFLEQHYRAHRARLEQQIGVAMDRNKLNQLTEVLNECNMQDIVQSNFKDRDYGLIGWQVRSTK